MTDDPIARLRALFPPALELPWPVIPCKSCGARIVWAETENVKPMPVDAAGDAAGNVMVSASTGGLIGDADTPIASILPKDTAPTTTYRAGVLRTVSHFATCPNANHHRKART